MASRRSAIVPATLVIAGVVLALGGIGLAWRTHRRQAALAGLAARTAGELSNGLAELGRRAGEQATRAARVSALRWALDHAVDGVTLADLLATEEWWKPYRLDLTLVARGGQLWASQGHGAERMLDRALLEKARGGAPALRWVVADGPVAAAAVTVGVRDHVLVLGQPLDAAALTALATSLDLALLVSDGGSARLFSGNPDRRAWLTAAVGHEGQGPRASLDGRVLATPVLVAPSWWIWAGSDPGLGFATPSWLSLALLGLGVLVGASAGLDRFRPPGAGQAPPAPPVAFTGSVVRTPMKAAPSGQASASGAGATTFGRYTLIDRIGEGGMSELFTAVVSGAEGFQRLFVIKRLKLQFTAQPDAVDQFVDEAKLGSLLVHSNIIPVFDFGKVGNGYYLAQEYIAGRNVTQLLRRQRESSGANLSVPIVCYIAHEVLAALSYAHERVDDDGRPLHIVHRDVSTGNIMITDQGEVKLCDFGIVRADLRQAATEVGHVKGNAAFMAPEQARGDIVDGRSDLFSLGMTMYCALTGESLYRPRAGATVFNQAVNGLNAEHQDRLRELPYPMPLILERTLARDPRDRYPNARAFAYDLSPHIERAKPELAFLMNSLFGDELRRQTASLRAMVTATARDAQNH